MHNYICTGKKVQHLMKIFYCVLIEYVIKFEIKELLTLLDISEIDHNVARNITSVTSKISDGVK